MRNVFVGLQMLTMLVLAGIFWREGSYRLATAQVCYLVATGLLFGGP